ncbi:aryl-sulfate sulfotransferase [Natronomonas sp.]|uniref:aryl-sulfate sulfotransferase n=1 Tax=Natronomonas sp. TaxID=2184060 RepID=UPI002FC3AB5C
MQRPRVMATSKTAIRLLSILVLLLVAVTLAHAATTGLSTQTAAEVPEAPPADNVTVVTESARAGTLIAYAPNGSVLYYNNSRTKYFDVDPVEGESMTVEYVATDTIHSQGPTCSDPPCAYNTLERANLSTGEVTELYGRYDYKETAGEWHDADRIDDERVVISDIVDDQVFIVNTETEVVEWLWDAQSEYSVEGGGPYPEDWAHVNDVEVLDDGRIMVSLRNQDQVVFLDRETGRIDDWTLGSEDAYDVQYEQHNPDYIPEERGGPAIVVADSENGRVQEFQRVDGEWERSWQWADDRIQWPRDADRLPNGNTLIADTHGKRVLEVDESGDVVWQVPVSHPYDVERLGTGDESSGGESAQSLGLESRTADDAATDGFSPLAPLAAAVHAVVPHRVINGVLYVGPAWMGRVEFFAVGVGALVALGWLGAEIRWRFPAISIRSPFYRKE